MAFSNTNKAIVAFKNLLGKSNTDVTKELGNEAEGIFLNVPASAVFMSSIPATPSGATSAGTAVFVTADMTLDGTSNGHGFFATWPVTPPTGTDPFTLSAYTYGAGTLSGITSGDRVTNAIPPSFGFLYEAKPFDTASNPISVGDVRNWIYQYNSGIFFQQDNLGLNPLTIRLYAYTGELLSGINFSEDADNPGFSGWTASTGVHSLIANNGTNLASGDYSISAGKDNVVSGAYSSIAGSSGNTVSGNYSTIVGGQNNTVTGTRSGIGAGIGLVNSFDDTWMATNMTAVTISAATFYSGSTNLSFLFAPSSSIGSGIRNFIQSGVSITVEENFQYLVYGDLTIYSGGTLTNNGQVVIINGSLTLSGGSFINSGSTLLVDLALNNAGKYTASFSTTANVPLNINHALGTQNFVYMTRQGTSEISVQLTIVDNNTVSITTTSSVSGGRITIIGV